MTLEGRMNVFFPLTRFNQQRGKWERKAVWECICVCVCRDLKSCFGSSSESGRGGQSRANKRVALLISCLRLPVFALVLLLVYMQLAQPHKLPDYNEPSQDPQPLAMNPKLVQGECYSSTRMGLEWFGWSLCLFCVRAFNAVTVSLKVYVWLGWSKYQKYYTLKIICVFFS